MIGKKYVEVLKSDRLIFTIGIKIGKFYRDSFFVWALVCVIQKNHLPVTIELFSVTDLYKFKI